MKALLLAAGLLLPLTGAATRSMADDAEAVQMASARLALAHVQAPPRVALCDMPAGPWRCGRIAELALQQRLATGEVRCADPDASGAAACTAGGEDLSVWMLEAGWARALSDAPARHLAAQEAARAARRGIWRDTTGRWRVPEEAGADDLHCDVCAARHQRVSRGAKARE